VYAAADDRADSDHGSARAGCLRELETPGAAATCGGRHAHRGPAVADKPVAPPAFAETDPGYAFLDPNRKAKPKDHAVKGFGVHLLMDPDSRCPKR
jgi:hypothetical protein